MRLAQGLLMSPSNSDARHAGFAPSSISHRRDRDERRLCRHTYVEGHYVVVIRTHTGKGFCPLLATYATHQPVSIAPVSACSVSLLNLAWFALTFWHSFTNPRCCHHAFGMYLKRTWRDETREPVITPARSKIISADCSGSTVERNEP